MLEVSDKKAKENFSILRSLMKALGGIWANLSLKLTTPMRKNKKRHYNERVQVENGSFTHLVSVYGGMGRECQHFIKRFGLIVNSRDEPVLDFTTWLRTKTSFALRSARMCIQRHTAQILQKLS